MGILIRDILEDSVKKFADIKAVKWLKKKDILERSYSELMDNVIAIRKSLLAEGFKGKHISMIGTSSVEWIEVIWLLLQEIQLQCHLMQDCQQKI